MAGCVPVVLYARLRDVNQTPAFSAPSIAAQSIGCVGFEYDIAPGGTESEWMFAFPYSDLVGAQALAAGRGVNLTGSGAQYILEFSFDGAEWDGSGYPDLAVDGAMLVEKLDRGLYLQLRGRPVFGGYADNAVDRLTLNSTALNDALSADVGTITPVDTGSTTPTYLYDGEPLPQQKGVFKTGPGPDGALGSELFFLYVSMNPVLFNARVKVDLDSNTNFLAKTAQDAIDVTTGMPIDGTPLGSYSHFVADTSSSELNLTGWNRGLAVGYLSTTPHITFSRTASPTDLAQALILEPDQTQPLMLSQDLTRAVRKVAGIGGYSNHGLPDGATIRQGTLINPPSSGTDVTWDANLYIFVASTSDGLGGFYYWPHDGLAYRIGQEIDGACSLCSSSDGYVYIAGLNGVFRWKIDTSAAGLAASLEQVGGLRASVKEVRFTTLGVVAWLAMTPTGTDGLFLWNGPTPDTGHGYDGWQILAGNGQLIGWAVAGGSLMLATTDNPATIQVIANPLTGGSSTTLVTASHISGIDGEPSGQYAVVRTDAGAAEMHLLTGTAISVLDGTSMVDGAGNLVQVNKVHIFPFSQTMEIDVGSAANPTQKLAVTFNLLADTDSGIYACDNFSGASWKTTPPQSGLSNQAIVDCQIALPQTLINRTTTRIFAVATKGLYISHSAGFWFDCETEEKVTIGAFLTALFRLSGEGLFPDNTITAIQVRQIAAGATSSVSIIDTPPGLGTSGKCLVLNTNEDVQMPDGYYWTMPLNERNKRTQRIVNVHSPSVTGRFLPVEYIDIQADSTTPAAVASGKLAQAIMRQAQDACLQEDSVVIPSTLAFARDASGNPARLRTLRPSHQAATDYARIGLDLTAVTWYVTRQRFYQALGTNFLSTETTLSTVFRTSDPTEADIGQALADTMGKVQRQAKIR